MIRRTKAEVLPQLPDKTIDILTGDMSAEGWEEYNRIEDDFRQWLIDNDLNENAVFAEALTKALYLRQCTVRHKNIKSVVDNFLENGKKILIFTQFTATVAYLQNIYDKITVSLTGATPTDERQGIIDQFQNDSGVRIFAATLKTGGVGLTLTAADTVLFTDLDWTPANHLQAEDRAHRIGQKNNVNVHYLIVPNTIEEKMWKVLHRKKDIVKSIIEGENTSMKSGVREVLEQLIHKPVPNQSVDTAFTPE
jgi:SWI/SNF-related matrix-associated actin-dependent regulator 1 of chromatin subfamily A